jgi:hypothetical protein
MTNGERLNQMPQEEYNLEMSMYENCTVKPYIDYEKWLSMDSLEYPIIGIDAILHQENGIDVECRLVEFCKTQMAPYVRLVVNQPGLHCFKSILVPQEKVTVINLPESINNHKLTDEELNELKAGKKVTFNDGEKDCTVIIDLLSGSYRIDVQ